MGLLERPGRPEPVLVWLWLLICSPVAPRRVSPAIGQVPTQHAARDLGACFFLALFGRANRARVSRTADFCSPRCRACPRRQEWRPGCRSVEVGAYETVSLDRQGLDRRDEGAVLRLLCLGAKKGRQAWRPFRPTCPAVRRGRHEYSASQGSGSNPFAKICGGSVPLPSSSKLLAPGESAVTVKDWFALPPAVGSKR
jgi:hypothetical protein